MSKRPRLEVESTGGTDAGCGQAVRSRRASERAVAGAFRHVLCEVPVDGLVSAPLTTGRFGKFRGDPVRHLEKQDRVASLFRHGDRAEQVASCLTTGTDRPGMGMLRLDSRDGFIRGLDALASVWLDEPMIGTSDHPAGQQIPISVARGFRAKTLSEHGAANCLADLASQHPAVAVIPAAWSARA